MRRAKQEKAFFALACAGICLAGALCAWLLRPHPALAVPPPTALTAQQQQSLHRLKTAVEPSLAETQAPEGEPKPPVAATHPALGARYGTVSVTGTRVACDLYWGDDATVLDAGAGTYAGPGGHLPGQQSTILVAGHTGSYFRDLESAQLGACIVLETDYGVYEYEITALRVVEATDASAYDLAAQEENIILYTCYPFGILTPTPQRYFVYGRLVLGQPVDFTA